MKPYYNTISLSGEKLEKNIARALAQEELVKQIFQANPNKPLSPSMIMKLVSKKYDRHSPITSWRRAITNLTDMGLLVKTDQKVEGLFGEPEHCWQLNAALSKTKVETIQQTLF
jgi:hypothetical protein